MLPRVYYPPFVVWCVFIGGTSIGLCFVPLFNLLAFEFAFAMSIPLTLVGGHCGTLLERDRRNWFDRGITITVISSALVFCALTPILLNAMRVQNCNLIEGLLLFVIFPFTGSLIALLWGATAESVLPNRV